MTHIAIVEDDRMYVNQLIGFVNQYKEEKGVEIDYDLFTDGALLLEKYSKGYNIILMDIEMPLLDGMSTAEEVRRIDDEVAIIFITNLAQYAIKGYSVGALDYVLKPISYFAFSRCLDKAIARLNKTNAQYITLRSNRGIQKLNVSHIYYIEVRDNSLFYHTSTGEYEVTGTLKSVEEMMKGKSFARGNSGYLINLNHVSAVTDNHAVVNGEKLPLSRSRKSGFVNALSDYVREMTK